MGYREVYNSAPVDLSAPLFLANIANGEGADRTYSLFSYKTFDAPSGVAYCLWARQLNTGDACDISWHVYRFDGLSGAALGNITSDDTLGGNLPLSFMQEVRNGEIYVFHANTLSWHRWDIHLTAKVGPQIWPTTPFTKFDGVDSGNPIAAYDPIANLIFQTRSGAGGAQQGKIYTYSTLTPWDSISFVNTAGFPHSVIAMEHPYGVAISRTGVQTTFNYVNGQVIHVTKHRPQLGISVHSSRRYGYDRFFHRFLMMDMLAQVGGAEIVFIRGFNPVPIVDHLQQPVAVREPRVEGVVRIFTRAIGSTGEGVAGVEVTFSDEGVGDVAPQIIITDQHGWAEANYDGLSTGGAETITVTAEIPADLFSPSEGQGSGFGAPQWAPDIDLDFDGFTLPNLDVDTILDIQVDWQRGTTDPRGCQTDVITRKLGKSSSCKIGINSGATGTPDTPTDGTFGGDLLFTATNQVSFDGQVWFGVWMYFPAGFDFSTSTDGLLLFRLGNDQTANYVEIRLKHGGGSGHTGYELTWPDETVTDARHDFTADSSGLISDDTWHFFQFYSNNKDIGADAAQRLWIDGILLWELVDDAARHLEAAGSGALVDFTADEAIPTATNTSNKFDELKVLNDWEGGAPASQVLYCQSVVWTQDALGLLGEDSEGNKFIDAVQQEAL